MKNSMDDSRTHRSESGFALIEVIVAAAVLAIVALAVLSGIDAASSTSAREKARAVAASLAEQDQERHARDDLRAGQQAADVDQQPPINVDGTTYKIESDVNLVTDDIGGTPECGDEGTQVTYVHITSTVTTPDTTVGTKIQPVKVDSLIPPTQKWAEGHGTLGVKVVDRSATKGVRNLSVAATSPAYTPPNESTDANGCAVFKDVPIGTYTITPELAQLPRPRRQPAVADDRQRRGQEGRVHHDVLRRRRQATVNVFTHAPASRGPLPRRPPPPVQTSKARNVTTMNGAKVGFAKTYTPTRPRPRSSRTSSSRSPRTPTPSSRVCRYESPDKVTTGASTTPLLRRSTRQHGACPIPPPRTASTPRSSRRARRPSAAAEHANRVVSKQRHLHRGATWSSTPRW